MTSNLRWHPRFSAYCLKKTGVMLISEKEFYWLPESSFPAFWLVDGTCSYDSVIGQYASFYHHEPEQMVRFVSQVNQLKSQGYLTGASMALDEQYQVPRQTSLESVYSGNAIEILNLSSSDKGFLELWCNALKIISETEENQVGETVTRFSKKMTFLLVDDLLDSRIADLARDLRYYCVIKITGNQLAVSPVFKHLPTLPENDCCWLKFQTCIYNNQPVRQFLTRLYPEARHVIPFDVTDRPKIEQWLMIRGLIQRQLETKQPRLLQFDIRESTISEHALHFAEDTELKAQFERPVVLQHVESIYNMDGGSRSISPTETVRKLMPYVDVITGNITHIKELASDDDAPIKIYKTAFYKTPLVRNLDTLNNNAFVQTCLGKGVSHEQSRASALCEAIERSNAQFKGDEPLYRASPSELSKRYISFQTLTPYSATQYQRFADSTDSESKRAQASIPYKNEPIHWLATWSLTNDEHVYVPLTCCFSNIEIPQKQTAPQRFEDDKFGRWNSNGAAAGNTLEEAILQGLYELIERDAAAIWWYNQIERPAFNLQLIERDFYEPIELTLNKDYHFWVLDITHDIGIPVMVAVGRHKETGGYLFGFGCHLQPQLAAQRALTELCQLIPIRNQQGAGFNFDKVEEGAYLHPSKDIAPEIPFTINSGDMKADILAIIGQLKACNLETLVVDFSRQPIPLYTVKVFVPGLCHIWPQLANERLYQVPVKLKWLNQAKNENTITSLGLYI